MLVDVRKGDMVTHKDYRQKKMVVVRVNQNGTIRCSWEDPKTGCQAEEDFEIEDLRRLGEDEADILEGG